MNTRALASVIAALPPLLMSANPSRADTPEQTAAETAAKPAPEAAVAVTVPFQITSTGHQLVTLSCQGKTLRMILDTAAGANVLDEKTVEEAGFSSRDSSEAAAGLGTTSHKMRQVDPLEFVISGHRIGCENLMAMDLSHVQAAGGGGRVDGLLGSPFFLKHKARIDFEKNELSFSISAADKPAAPPDAAASGERLFSAEIAAVHTLGEFKGTLKVAAVDPRYVVEVRLKEEVEGIGGKDETVAFAIHSPARDLAIPDNASAKGKDVRLKISGNADDKTFRLTRDTTTAPDPSSGSGTQPRSSD